MSNSVTQPTPNTQQKPQPPREGMYGTSPQSGIRYVPIRHNQEKNEQYLDTPSMSHTSARALDIGNYHTQCLGEGATDPIVAIAK